METLKLSVMDQTTNLYTKSGKQQVFLSVSEQCWDTELSYSHENHLSLKLILNFLGYQSVHQSFFQY